MNKRMQYFISVVDTHSFTKAAEECYISQSAISQQIKSLEDELQVQLLIRNKKSFSLTPAGEYFYKQSKVILRQIDELCKKTKEIEEDDNVLKIGYLRGYHGKEIREAVIEFCELYPQVSIELQRGNHEELYDMLVNQSVNLVISDQRRAFHEDYFNYHLLNINCYVEINKQNPLSNKEVIDIEDLKDQVCILVASKDQQEIEREFYENIIGLKCQYTFAQQMDEAQLMVTINKGILPVERSINDLYETNQTKLIPLFRNQRQIQRNYCAFWQKKYTNYYIEEFAEILRKKMRIAHED